MRCIIRCKEYRKGALLVLCTNNIKENLYVTLAVLFVEMDGKMKFKFEIIFSEQNSSEMCT